MRILVLFGTLLYLVPDFIFRMILWCKPFPKHQQTFAILRLDKMGDMVLFANACQSLVAHIETQGQLPLIICHPGLVPLVKGWMPNAHLFGVDPQKLWYPSYRYKQCWRLYRFGIQTFFHPAVSHYQYLGSTTALLRILPRHRAIGYRPHVRGWRAMANTVSEWHYNAIISANNPTLSGPPAPPLSAAIPPHEGDYHMAALQYFGAPYLAKNLEMPLCKREWDFPVSPYILIAPGASHDLRRWPIGRFVSVIQRLQETDPDKTIVIIGTQEESGLGEILRRHTDHCVDLTGKTTVIETWQLVAHSALILTNETGVAQMGATLGKKTLVLTGGGHWGRFVPHPTPSSLVAVHVKRPCYNCDWQCIYPRQKGEIAPCMGDISVEAVLSAVQVSLGEPPAPSRHSEAVAG